MRLNLSLLPKGKAAYEHQAPVFLKTENNLNAEVINESAT